MKKYIVYLSTGERVCVEAEDFEFDTEGGFLIFQTNCESKPAYNKAIFNFTNIQGFCQGYMSEEKEQKYYD